MSLIRNNEHKASKNYLICRVGVISRLWSNPKGTLKEVRK